MTTTSWWVLCTTYAALAALLFWAWYSLRVTRRIIADTTLRIVRLRVLLEHLDGPSVPVDDVRLALDIGGPDLTPPDWPTELRMPPRHAR